ncbi:thioredoxin family protein [Microlunatus soli]|uniref:Thioredoxin n=1 Tax=Microlunatus soli TaxID=630515 RepID=A0A1H1VBQ5_9ACTN|nr:thioredoxin family protein [Microlunatus soli]SDS81901.1 Thioredoxin [Microlunatus soli]
MNDVLTGLIALLIASAVAVAVVIYRRRVDGRFRRAPERVAERPRPSSDDRLSGAELGDRLGPEATVVQFSSSFCAPCRVAERVIRDAVGGMAGVRYVDLDAERHLDLARRFKILRTPTVLVADADGRIIARTSGVPTKQSLLAVIPSLDSR